MAFLLRLIVARCRFHVCKCNPLRVSCVSNRSRCSAASILVHLVANPPLRALRHASRDVDLRADSQILMWETWILHMGSTVKAAEA